MIRLFCLFIFLSVIFFPELLLAEEIKLFQSIPFIQQGSDLSTQAYVDALYDLSIGLASILVVLKLVWAGVKYMFSEVVTGKEEAKKDIKASLLGLLIILAAVTLLNTINPQLTNLDFLKNAPGITPSTKGSKPGKVETPSCQGTECQGNNQSGGGGF